MIAVQVVNPNSPIAAVDPPAQVLVGEDVDITLRKVITNNRPSAPMDVEVTQTATAPPDATVKPTMAVSTEPALELNELREVFEVFTINCGAASHHTFTFENESQPLDPADTDPDQSNHWQEHCQGVAGYSGRAAGTGGAVDGGIT